MNTTVMFTESDLIKIKVAVPEVAKVVSALQNSIASFESILNDPGIQSWLAGTEVGMQLRERVLHNISSLTTLANVYSQFCEKTEEMVSRFEKIMRANEVL